MKKRILIALLMTVAGSSLAAQTPITQITGTTSSVGALKDATNTRMSAAQANFSDLYTNKANASCFASESAFNACFALDWPAGDDLGTATAAAVSALFSGSGEYLRADGTKGTPVGGGASAINDLADVNTTGKAAGKILVFDASGNLVVGDDQIGASGTGDIEGVTAGTGLTGGGTTGTVTVSVDPTYAQRRVSSSCSAGTSIRVIAEDGTVTCETDDTGSGAVPNGTVNGQVLLWATDQWAASTPPWVTTASLGTGVATALSAAVDGTGGLASKASLDALPNIVFGTGLTLSEDTPSAGTDTVSITANIYQSYDADLTTAAGATGAGNSKYFGTNSGGTAGFYDLPTGGEGYTNLTAFVGQTAWRLFYSDGAGDVKELAIGASGTVLKSNGESAAPSFQTDSTGTGGGTGDDISVIDCGDSATTTSITIDGGDAS